LYGQKASDTIQILYGGSVKESSAAEYLGLDEIDGLLVGGASLDAHAFNEIIKKAHKPASAGKE
jgi:triosephosphate isomerase